jgi:putative photosynthetic complex assembly protein 2
MLDVALPVLCALFVWWFSTGLLLYLVALSRRTYRWSLLGMTLLTVAALWGLSASANDATATGAYAAFACAIVVWGWQEICFLTGVTAGPRVDPCPADLGGWKRVGAAIRVILYHELQLLALGVAIVIATAGGANLVGVWTFAVLWTMRLSAKLNLFLGVPFLHDDWMPRHLRYVATYFRIRSMNYLFPVTVTASSIVVFVLVRSALAPETSPFDATAQLLLASLLALAVLEHWFMVLPLPVARLWAWFRARRASGVAGGETTMIQAVVSPSSSPDAPQPAADHPVIAKPQPFIAATQPVLVFSVPTPNGGRP